MNLALLTKPFKPFANPVSKIALSFATLLSLSGVTAQADEIDDFIKQQMSDKRIPGLQLAIVRDNKIIRLSHYGVSNIQDSVPVTEKTIFTINSMTKGFTGVAIMQLVEQGKLELDVKISRYLDDLPPAWQKLTIRQLMAHTSGLPAVLGNWAKLISPEGFDASLELAKTKPMMFEADTRYQYNQTGYVLLGKIIDKVSGMPFADFITKYQLDKVGMPKTKAAGFAHYESVVPHRARAYTYYMTGNLTNMTADFAPPLRTAAGMSSSAEELAKWSIALQTGKLFSKSDSLEKLWQPNVLKNGKTAGFNNFVNGYAQGWPIINRKEHPAAASLGADRSALVVYPEDNMSIVILTNLTGSVPERFSDEIAGFFIPDMKAENGFGLPPAIKALWNELESKGYENALKYAKALQSKGNFKFKESEINSWGYQLAGLKKLQKAMHVFQLNTQLYPKSANTYDSLAEVYWMMGNTKEAINLYKKVLKMQPDNKHALNQLKKLKALN